MGGIVIRSENDAWDVLRRALDGEFDKYAPDIEFSGWPSLVIKVEIPKQTITPPLMVGFLAFQNAIYRSYSILKHETRNINKLTEEEKRALEISIYVSDGSSVFKAFAERLAKELSKVLRDKLEARHWVIIIVSVSLMYFSHSAYHDYLKNQLEERKAHVQLEEKRVLLESQKFLSAEETKKLELFARAMGEHKELPRLGAEVDISRQTILKGIGKTGDASIAGAEVSQELARELAKNPRHVSEKIEIQGEFRILNVDTTHPEGFRVRLERVTDKLRLTAGITDIMVSEKQREIIKNAEWEKKTVILTIDAKRRGDQIVDAIIKDAKKPKSDS